MASQNEEYAGARAAWEEWCKRKIAEEQRYSDQPLHNSFKLFKENNWAWASFKEGWDACLKNVTRVKR